VPSPSIEAGHGEVDDGLTEWEREFEATLPKSEEPSELKYRLPLPIQIAQFWHFYPGIFWRDEWPTDDNAIPWKLFFLYWQTQFAVRAYNRLEMGHAVNFAIGNALGGKEAGTGKTFKRWMSEAFPGRGT